MQRLGIIPNDFPNVAVKAVRAKAVVMNPKERLIQAIEEFSTVFEVEKELKTMEEGPMHIHLKDEKIRPLHICNPCKTP